MTKKEPFVLQGYYKWHCYCVLRHNQTHTMYFEVFWGFTGFYWVLSKFCGFVFPKLKKQGITIIGYYCVYLLYYYGYCWESIRVIMVLSSITGPFLVVSGTMGAFMLLPHITGYYYGMTNYYWVLLWNY